MNLIESWAFAIKKHEGWYAGSRSFRNNNPGNFRCSKLMTELGATRCEDNFSVFPNYETGWKALIQFLTYAAKGELRSYKADGSLYDFYKVYAPSGDGNYPKGYAEAVAKDMGVSPNASISSFLSDKPQEIKIENQLDKKWKKYYLGKVKTSGFNDYGCFLFCLTYLYSVKNNRQISPVDVDKIFMENGVYSRDLIDSVKAAKVLGLQYFGKESDINKAPKWNPSIKEVDFSIKNGKQQHFVIRTENDGKKVILDPYEGVTRPINYYEKKTGAPNWENKHFSYRLFKI